MQPLTSVQLKKLEKLAKVGDIGIADELNALEGRLEGLEAIVPALREARDGEMGPQGERGEKGESIKGDKGDRGMDGRDGKDSTVPGPQGPRGETGPQGVPGVNGVDGKDGNIKDLSPQEIRDSLELLQGEERIDVSSIRGVEEAITEIAEEIAKKEAKKIDGNTTVFTRVSSTGSTTTTTLGDDENYVTDAEKVIIGNTSGINTGDQTIKDTFGITVDGGVAVLTTGTKGYRYIEQDCTITGWHLQADASGDVVFDVKRSGVSIAGTEKPTLTAQQTNSDLALTTWTTSLVAGDIIEFVIDSASTITRATLTVLVTKI